MSGIKKSFDLELTQNDVTTLTDDELGVCDGIAITSASTNTEEIRISNRGDVAADKGTPLLPGKTALIKKIDPRNLGLFTTGASHSISVSIGAEIEILGSDVSGGDDAEVIPAKYFPGSEQIVIPEGCSLRLILPPDAQSDYKIKFIWQEIPVS